MGIPRHRERGGGSVLTTLGSQTVIPLHNDSVTKTDVSMLEEQSKEICDDELHADYPKSGGPFSLTKKNCYYADHFGWHGYDFLRYSGTKRYVDRFDGNYRAGEGVGNPTHPSDDSINTATYGADCWNRFKPGQPHVGLGQFFAELTSVRDMIFRRMTRFRHLGSNYLAMEFGWKPFLSDIARFLESVQKIDARVAQLRSDNGRWIRRGGTLLEENDSGILYEDDVNRITPHDDAYRSAVSKAFYTSKSHVWFSGAFRYYIPGLLDQKWGDMRAFRELYDLKLTPNLAYELFPFSWLANWFSNLGSVVNNLQSSIDDHLVAKYAYVMRESSYTQTNESSAMYQQGTTENGIGVVNHVPVICSTRVEAITKTRAVADPFGFTVDLPDLSSWQVSILAALGLSRAR